MFFGQNSTKDYRRGIDKVTILCYYWPRVLERDSTMISTVITSTITTITTVTAIVGFGVALGVVAVVALIGLLGAKELTSVSASSTHRFLAKSLDVGIVPLGIAFAVIVAVKVVEILA